MYGGLCVVVGWPGGGRCDRGRFGRMGNLVMDGWDGWCDECFYDVVPAQSQRFSFCTRWGAALMLRPNVYLLTPHENDFFQRGSIRIGRLTGAFCGPPANSRVGCRRPAGARMKFVTTHSTFTDRSDTPSPCLAKQLLDLMHRPSHHPI